MTHRIAWHCFDKCEECGVDPAARCRTDDDLADAPCAGRRLLPAAVPAVVFGVPEPETALLAPDEALDRIAASVRGGADGLRAALSVIEDVTRFVRLSGRNVEDKR